MHIDHSYLPRLTGGVFLIVLLPLWALAGEGSAVALVGEVLDVSTSERILRLRHHPMADSSAVETESELLIGRGDALILSPGMIVRGRAVAFDGGVRLEHIWPADRISEKLLIDAGVLLRHDTVIRGSKAYRAIGEKIPDFALYDQNGTLVQSQSWRGRRVILNFIFTRCPMPMMCPAATGRMVNMQRVTSEDAVEDLLFVSISFDPDYDSPGILKEFMIDHGIEPGNFLLLTGRERSIRDILKQFGVFVERKGDTINHSMATILIDERGEIVFRKDGARWSEDEFLQRL